MIAEILNKLPSQYISGVDRKEGGENRSTHLYEGTMNNVGLPLCRNGYDEFGGFSIFRNNISKKGVCMVCLKLASLGLEGVEFKMKS